MKYYIYSDDLLEGFLVNFDIPDTSGTIDSFYQEIINEVIKGGKEAIQFFSQKADRFEKISSKISQIVRMKSVKQDYKKVLVLLRKYYDAAKIYISKTKSKMNTFKYNCNRVKNNLLAKLSSKNLTSLSYELLMKINKPILVEYQNFFDYLESKFESFEIVDNKASQFVDYISDTDDPTDSGHMSFVHRRSFQGALVIESKFEQIKQQVSQSNLTTVGIIFVTSYIVLYGIIRKITKQQFSIFNVPRLVSEIFRIFKTGTGFQKITILIVSIIFIASLGYLGYQGIRILVNYLKNKK